MTWYDIEERLTSLYFCKQNHKFHFLNSVHYRKVNVKEGMTWYDIEERLTSLYFCKQNHMLKNGALALQSNLSPFVQFYSIKFLKMI